MHNVFLFLIIIFLPSLSEANNDVIKKHVPNYQLVGSGVLSKFFWDIYKSELYAPEGKFSWDKPFALKITYFVDIDKEDIVEKTISEIKNQGFTDRSKLKKWSDEMLKAIPDVYDGTELTGIYTKNKNTIFFSNEKEEVKITDKGFGKKFFSIWLDKKSSEKSQICC